MIVTENIFFQPRENEFVSPLTVSRRKNASQLIPQSSQQVDSYRKGTENHAQNRDVILTLLHPENLQIITREHHNEAAACVQIAWRD